MENKIYYGEYSLKHWINLMLTKNITLPDYQRLFVWTEEKVEKLIQTFQEKEFVPPITIGAFKVNGTNNNLIIDGQQRLTSILLAYLGLFPDKNKIEPTTIEMYVDENDDVYEKENYDNILEWKFTKLIDKGSNKNDILKKVEEEKEDYYKIINFNIDENFLETNYLGFCYLVPDTSKVKQQKYYSSIFRNINIQGEPLSPQESREALYYLDETLVPFFNPDFIKTTVIIQGKKSNIDFARYLSLLSQYHKDKEVRKVARSYKPKMEKYYEEYIDSVINDKDDKYGKFSNIFPRRDFEERYSKLQEALKSITIPIQFSSIIDLDLYFFGLIYTIVFEDKQIDIKRKGELKSKIETKISKYKSDDKHKKSPSNLGHLRERISSSIEIFNQYAS